MKRPLLVLIVIMLWAAITPARSQEPALLLFGGSNHRTFLGCVNCSRHHETSIWNAHGQYGSIYSAESIWNRYGEWGSKYSSESPWNKYSSTAPIIVDNSGKSYGYFSANAYLSNRTRIGWLVYILDNYEEVRENLDKIRGKFP